MICCLVMMTLKNNQRPGANHRSSFLLAVLLFVLTTFPVLAASEQQNKRIAPIKITTPELNFRLFTRGQEDMAAFYEGRQFSFKLINALKEVCFFTVIVKNKSSDVIWLEPDSWPVQLASGKNTHQLDQVFWRKRWQELKIKQSSQSTFRWTLLPDSRDLRPDEGVGGNYILPFTNEKIKLTPVFRMGAEGKTSLRLPTQTLQCGAR
jgi:hypothetical protein